MSNWKQEEEEYSVAKRIGVKIKTNTTAGSFIHDSQRRIINWKKASKRTRYHLDTETHEANKFAVM